ncbi:hypothetical protein HK102_013194, partial [Quaeritorhiza haematococci]
MDTNGNSYTYSSSYFYEPHQQQPYQHPIDPPPPLDYENKSEIPAGDDDQCPPQGINDLHPHPHDSNSFHSTTPQQNHRQFDQQIEPHQQEMPNPYSGTWASAPPHAYYSDGAVCMPSNSDVVGNGILPAPSVVSVPATVPVV